VKRRALICGISGQDGAYLAKLLVGRGYDVWGTSRDVEMASFANLHRLKLHKEVNLVSLNLRDAGQTFRLLQQIRPDEIYNLAAQNSVSLSFEQPVETIESIMLGTVNLLEGIRLAGLKTRLYNASSTECFGDTGSGVADENSPLLPRSPYAVAKAASYWVVTNYRNAYNLFACSGILSNHESPLRPKRFVTRKIIRAAAEIASGIPQRLRLGNLSVERDWGWAPEYVEAMWLMLQQDQPRDFVIATGHSFTLEDFVKTAFEAIGKNWEDFVDIDSNLLRPSDIQHSKVNPSQANHVLGWRAQRTMPDVVRAMVEGEFDELKNEEKAPIPTNINS